MNTHSTRGLQYHQDIKLFLPQKGGVKREGRLPERERDPGPIASLYACFSSEEMSSSPHVLASSAAFYCPDCFLVPPPFSGSSAAFELVSHALVPEHLDVS